jgi:hypothetical protein
MPLIPGRDIYRETYFDPVLNTGCDLVGMYNRNRKPNLDEYTTPCG